MAAGDIYIGKDARWSAEDAIFQGNTLKDRDVIFDFDIVADNHVFGDEHVLANGTVFADGGLWHYMGKVPDFGALTDI